MSLSSAMNAGVSGLAANSSRLGTISDNIANSGTFGYKRVESEFHSIVLNQTRVAGLYSAGGVRVTTSRIIDEDGALTTTTNPLDLAISGRGFLPVTSAADLDNGMSQMPFMMTRTGSFRADQNGILRTDGGLVLLGWAVDSNGNVPLASRDTVGTLEPVRIQTNQASGDPTNRISLGVNLPATETRAGSSGAELPLRVEYYGNLGTAEYLDVKFEPTLATGVGMSNTWTMTISDSATDPAANPIASYRVIFNDTQALGGSIVDVIALDGAEYDRANGTVQLNVGGGGISMFVGVPGGGAGLKQLSASFSPTNIVKNGSPVGNLVSVEIDQDGFIRASYDTGFIKRLYQIPLVDVPNPNGLITTDGQSFKISPISGSFFLWDAGDGPTGNILGYAREASTTDVAQELTELITTQRAYSSNAKIIQTVDEMLQETTNIKR
ncbi:flagellar hook protein FlgE [Paracoccus tibetensis]|uniref:Flagellar hook protein FlgE n=1 Tax=Paracoccus tibetensis TaxID=336292 RepID=A0A1G5INN5_9RHOB|nr:flagellar hook-basal body complex protein [Paracoccus tibetensis]SCY77199.1 flagellar hook protein FlgE [Paracoccus tibetensis]